MEIWRRRPDAQQLGKVRPPSQPADNFKPPACVGACAAAEEPPHKLPEQATQRTEKSDRHVRSHLLVSISKETTARVGRRRRKTRAGCTFLYFSLAFLPQDRRLAALPRDTNSRNSRNDLGGWGGWREEKNKPRRRSVRVKRGIQLVELALSLHIAAGECALKITWSFKWKKKRNPLARGGVCAENRHFIQQISYSSPSRLQQSPHRGEPKTCQRETHALSLLSPALLSSSLLGKQCRISRGFLLVFFN